MSHPNMFDSNREIEIRLPAPDGIKTAIVRFPSDEQWSERMRVQRTVIRDLGRGQSETQILGAEEADLALFQAVRIDKDGPAFDAAEAAAVIRRLSRADTGEPEREGNAYRIPLTVPGAETVHVLRMPSERQLLDYRRSAVRVIESRHGRSELRINLTPAAELYDALKQTVEGYTGAVPIIHKSAVINELLQELRTLEEEPDPANFQSGRTLPASAS
ncbi:MAG TPA: hypothetical protein VMX97_08680 [Hyphomicrobiaceae bacterium]|nr:hypothetical protein [Hyphomicrobiaceae bacterium]